MGTNNEEILMVRNESKPCEYNLLGLYALLVYLSAQLHEMGHWLMATLLGLKFALGFNLWQIISEANIGQKLAVLAAGPAITLAFIAVGFLMFYYMRDVVLKRIGLLLVISNSLMVLIYNLLSLLTGGMGDSGWIALYLGLPQYAMKLPLVLVSAVAMIAGFRRVEPEMKRVKWTLGLFIVLALVMGLIVLLDKLVWRSYEHRELLFPIWGTSAIILLTNSFLLTILIVFLWKESIYSYKKAL